MQLVLLCLFVMFAKIVEISINSIKTVCMVKGEKRLAAILAFIEVLIWCFVVSSIITDLKSNIWLLMSYAIGYSLGLFFGTNLANKINIGTTSIQVMVNDEKTKKIESYLKEKEFGYMVLNGHGAKEEMNLMIMVLPRKTMKETMKEIRTMCDGHVFMISSDVNQFVGGYGLRK